MTKENRVGQRIVAQADQITFGLGHYPVVYFIEQTRNGREDGRSQSLKVVSEQFYVALIKPDRATMSQHGADDHLQK